MGREEWTGSLQSTVTFQAGFVTVKYERPTPLQKREPTEGY